MQEPQLLFSLVQLKSSGDQGASQTFGSSDKATPAA